MCACGCDSGLLKEPPLNDLDKPKCVHLMIAGYNEDVERDLLCVCDVWVDYNSYKQHVPEICSIEDPDVQGNPTIDRKPSSSFGTTSGPQFERKPSI